MNQPQSDTCWPDGTPRSQGNAFDVLSRSQRVSSKPAARSMVGVKHGKALPFSLPGTRARTRRGDTE
ncbi:hypothetical protein CTTA_4949 [Comamonas testosteroni]|uniref:Uncharacterized protein n=1 Tax=Comamonas testosteroni TaxID=285 RepID=A0A5A7MMF2_COMTE|nr:hypothetical protein CTTA_4949 [Comamonas testosteroni]